MPPAKPALQREPVSVTESENLLSPTTAFVKHGPRRLTPAVISTPAQVAKPLTQPRKESNFQPRVPVITGEATYRGLMPVDGIISGHLGATGSTLAVRQRPRNGSVDIVPELNGEITFKDMLRINGYVAGKVSSCKGTLIVDPSARVDADISVGVCIISGIVNGDVVAHERVELGAAATINGNIATQSITMKPGAVFHGDCRMLIGEEDHL
jgi:hypothetical protein